MVAFIEKYFEKIIGVLLILVLTILIDYFIDNLINRTIKKKKKKNLTTLLVFLKRIKRVVLYVIAILVCLAMFDIFSKFSVTLLSGLGIGSVVIGLAAQESLKNFFGSVAIVLSSPYEVGDFIECVDKKVSGTVEDITFRHTVIKTIHNRRVIIPNGEMNYYTIENFNYNDNEVVKLIDYMISYDADVEKAISIMKEEMSKLYAPQSKNEEFPKVRVSEWKDSGIYLRAWIWGKDNSDVFENMYKLNYAFKKRFQEANIEIPYPHVNVITTKSKK